MIACSICRLPFVSLRPQRRDPLTARARRHLASRAIVDVDGTVHEVTGRLDLTEQRFSAHTCCLSIFAGCVLAAKELQVGHGVSDNLGAIIGSLDLLSDGRVLEVDYRLSVESIFRPPTITPKTPPPTRPGSTSSTSSFVLPSLIGSSRSSWSSSWSSIPTPLTTSAKPLPALPGSMPYIREPTYTHYDAIHARTASGTIIETFEIPIGAFFFPLVMMGPDVKLEDTETLDAKHENALLDGVSLDESVVDEESEEDDQDTKQNNKNLRQYVHVSAKDAEDFIYEQLWHQHHGDPAKSLKNLIKFARGKDWLLERPNFFPKFFPRVSASRLPCFTPISTNASTPPHRTRLHLLALPSKILRGTADFLSISDLVRLSGVCIHLRGFILTSCQPIFKQRTIDLGWPLVPRGLVVENLYVEAQEADGAHSEVATAQSPDHGDWLLYLQDVHAPWMSMKKPTLSNTTAASTLARRRCYELSLRILAVARRNLSPFLALHSPSPTPPTPTSATLDLFLSDPSQRAPTLPAGSIPSPRLSLSETEFVTTTPRSPIAPWNIPVRIRRPTMRKRPTGNVYDIDIPNLGHLLPPSSPPPPSFPSSSYFNPSRPSSPSQALFETLSDNAHLLTPSPTYTWDQSYNDSCFGVAISPSNLSAFASDAGTSFSISSTPPVKLRRRLFEAVVHSVRT
ncbi:hypothetical protein P7C70_g3438, partial [Phenoliferia sp. Uapishka_3]